MAIKPLSSTAVDQVVARLGFVERPAADVAGLHAVYSAWCRRVPFDNLRKLVGLHFAMPELPGIHPDDFFAAWQLTGAGGTCWASNNAIHALLVGLGFDARLFAASMFDGEINHGTTIVTIDGDQWLVDTAVHGDVPAPLRGVSTSVEHEGYVTTVRPDGGSWVFECPTPDPGMRIPCRIHGTIDAAFTLEASEKSRGSSPFNQGIMAGINDEAGVWMLKEGRLVRYESSATTSRELSDAEADEWLVEVAGHSPQLVAEVRAILDFQAESADS
ncbi:MAG: arylamine N-acetyltransferase [Acidimicrobiales bacterium]